MTPKPLYTTIENSHLERLLAAKYCLDCITEGIVDEGSLRLIIISLKKAVKKHPHFADCFCDDRNDTDGLLACVRMRNDSDNRQVATSVLTEELLEAELAWKNGDKDEVLSELADCGAVILRMMGFAEREMRREKE